VVLLLVLIGHLCVLPAAASIVDQMDNLNPPIDDTPRPRDIVYPEWFKHSFLDLQEDLDEATENGKTGLVIYFGQKNCAYCEALMERNFGQRDITEYTRKHFDIIPLDIWGSREVTTLDGQSMSERDFSIREDTNFTPSLMFFDRDGTLALRLRGYYPPYKFRAALEYVVDGYYKDERFRDYLLRADPPPKFDVADLNEHELFLSPPYALDRSRFPASQPLIVFFEQKECHACDVLHSEPLHDLEVLDLLEQMDVVQLDMWSDARVITPDGRKTTAREWANELGLFFAPTIVIFDEQGKEIFRVESVVRMYRLARVLDYVLSKGYLTAPNFQRWHGRREPFGE
jgi:thioredoxin-related protein